MLATGLWVVALEYVARPSARWAVLGGLLAAGILLTHGTEVYTSAIGLLGLAIPAAVLALRKGRSGR